MAEDDAALRRRFTGSDTAIRAAILPLMQANKSFIRCCDAEHVQDSRISLKDVQAHPHLLANLHALCGNLAFKRSQLEAVINDLATSMLSLTAAEQQDYTRTIASRIRNLCYFVANNERKKKPPSWVCTLPWHKEKDGPPLALPSSATTPSPLPATKSTSKPPKGAWLYGWNTELCRAFRCKAPGAKVDLALPHEVEDTAAGSDPLMAVWEDGTRHPVEDVTVEMWRAMQASRHSKSGNEALWQGERLGTFHKLRIAQRTDRCLLLSLYEQSSQIANVRIDRWGALPGVQPCVVPNNTPAVQAALEFLRPLAIKYEKGILATVADLKKEMYQLLKAVPKPHLQGGTKRAASCEGESTRSADDEVKHRTRLRAKTASSPSSAAVATTQRAISRKPAAAAAAVTAAASAVKTKAPLPYIPQMVFTLDDVEGFFET